MLIPIRFTFHLDKCFDDGKENSKFYRDRPFFTEYDGIALATFLSKISNGEPLPGKNKPSWLDNNLEKLPGTDLYEKGNYWHYHAGLEYHGNVNSMTHNLGINLYGLTSSNIIHYTKDSDDTITVVGYSPEHIPFLRDDDLNNALFK